MFLPRSQKAVFNQLIELARAKLNSVAVEGLLIQPRIIPLLHGPTGAGKTFLAELTAKELGARFHKVEIANWIPTGARDAEPTVKTIRELLLEIFNRHLRPWSGRWLEGFLSTDMVIN